MLTGLILLLATATSASAATSGEAVPATTILAADPAPAPSPSPSVPGIGLGPGAPGPVVTAPPPATAPSTSSSGDDPSWWDIPGQIKKAIDDFFAGLVKDALNPVLSLLGRTLLATPDVTTMGRVGQIWTGMAVLANSLYVLFVLAGAVIIMTHETLQTRYAAKQIIPRLFVGFIAGNASLALFGLVIHVADIVSMGIMGQGLDPNQAGPALANMITGSITGLGGGIFLSILGLAVAAMAIVLLITYIVRVALAIILAVSAPLALATLALPQTEGVARLWWRASLGTLAVQLGQSLTLIAGLQVLLDPGGVTAIGLPTGSGFVDLLVFLALFWILIRIPVWVSRMIFGRSHSKLMSLGKEVLAYKAMGLVGKAAQGRGKPSGPDGAVPNRAPSTALALRSAAGGASGGGRGGGWSPGPSVYTVTRVPGPSAPATIGRALPGAGPRLAIGPGPDGGAAPPGPPELGPGPRGRRASNPPGEVYGPARGPIPMPAGRQGRLDTRQRAATEEPKPRHVQRGLFPPVPKTPRPAPASTIWPEPAAPARPRVRQDALFPRSAALTPPPAASPAEPVRPISAPRAAVAPSAPPPPIPAAGPARMTAAPSAARPMRTPADAPLRRIEPARPASAPTPTPAPRAPRAPRQKGPNP
ncbi:hypothetical protein [Catenulispora sp. GAS73]|uniref:hypothetical protein n=1 Tax=Catenulispora sp. GAS73 TaxID=3156269 RepID=UPI00351866FE